MSESDYQPIENHGVIGDLHSVALVCQNGAVDFLCFPDFDSPTVFAALLDSRKGGHFSLTPAAAELRSRQMYLPDTNVLLTRFLCRQGVGELTDFMPVDEHRPRHALLRRVTVVLGCLRFRMECRPRFDYARSAHEARLAGREILFQSQGADALRLRLVASVALALDGQDGVAEFTLHEGESADFSLELPGEADTPLEQLGSFVDESLEETLSYWKDWSSRSSYRGRWSEMVHRSALVLKLMTSQKHGSIVAAPTFGLPEEIGGLRNWDYRYTWIRDASFTVYALIRFGYRREARCFMSWVEKKCQDIGDTGALQLMYSLDGSNELEEQELPQLEGYRGSAPVRIGNAAYRQVQLDIYGELLDAAYLYDRHVEALSYGFWCDLMQQVRWVCANWQREDEGIWEVRGGKRHFLYSRLMCWVAIDRAMKIGERHSYPYPARWRQTRDTIFHSIHEDFWNEELQSFVQYKGARSVDAATLLMPIVRFIGFRDPRWLSTLARIERDLVSASLVYRYRPRSGADGLSGGEGTFSMCTFWYAECLARSGQLRKARLVFEKMLSYSNPLGLYAEQLGMMGEHLGNFPQAFTHLGLISAALSLDEQLDDRHNNELGR